MKFQVIAPLWIVVLAAASVAAGQAPPKTKAPAGQKIFASMCASCHGLDGRGGERAPDIVQAAAVQRLSKDKLRHIVEEGVPGTGMPAFHSLGGPGITAVVNYLRVLQGKERAAVLPGDAARGKTLFFGTAGCSSCHMISGAGSFIASDLSGYGAGHSVSDIREAISHSNLSSESSHKHAIVTTRDGKTYTGIVRNEDNFSIQLQALDGTFHFFDKADVSKLEHQAPAVPKNANLENRDLNDLVRFLVAASSETKTQATPQETE